MDFLTHIFEPAPLSDWLMLALLGTAIFLLIAAAEGLRRFRNWPTEFTRKLVHVLVGIAPILMPMMLQTSLPVLVIAGFFTLFNWISIKKGWLPALHGSRHSYGTAFYPLSIFILALCCWQNHKLILIVSMLVLAFGDAAAAIVGKQLKSPCFRLLEDEKSLAGSLTMFVVTAIVVGLGLLYYGPDYWPSPLSPALILAIAMLTGLIAIVAEAMSARGSDNLSVPLATATILFFLLENGWSAIPGFTVAVGLSLMAAIAFWKLRFLSLDGAAATFLLATVIFGFGGWMWTVPILTFFILSSLLSKIARKYQPAAETETVRGSRRDAVQVGANGSIPGLLMICQMFYPEVSLYPAYLVSLAAATADTWSTEIGGLFGKSPWEIHTGRPVAPGTSGGVTLAGLIGGAAGAGAIALSGFVMAPFLFSVSLILLFGVLGTTLDSLLGALVQVRFRCQACNHSTEKKLHCGKNTVRVKGIKWIDNDVVNLLSISGATMAFLLIGQ